jgi:hypothetical protein
MRFSAASLLHGEPLMPFFKQKSMSEKAEQEQAKLQMKQLRLQGMRTDAQMKAEKEKMMSAEMRRLRA